MTGQDITPFEYKNCLWLFHQAERMHEDLMEPWSALVAEAVGMEERVRVMRNALTATFRQRYPMPPGRDWPSATQAPATGQGATT